MKPQVSVTHFCVFLINRHQITTTGSAVCSLSLQAPCCVPYQVRAEALSLSHLVSGAPLPCATGPARSGAPGVRAAPLAAAECFPAAEHGCADSRFPAQPQQSVSTVKLETLICKFLVSKINLTWGSRSITFSIIIHSQSGLLGKPVHILVHAALSFQ